MADRDAHERRRRDVGAGAVEMAIIIPVLVALVFGIIDFGRMLNAEIQLSTGAREGVRLAALAESVPSYSSSANALPRVQSAAPNPGFQAGGVSISAYTPCASTSSAATVSVKYHFSGIIWSRGSGIDLTQTAVMRCGG